MARSATSRCWSSSPSVQRAAVEAVKQWRYSPIPFEGLLLTVTVNFTLR
jgi:outer membrane biosynthesis protein TonB